jgi:hypothetical protein
MKIYYYSSNAEQDSDSKQIVSWLKKSGVQVMDNSSANIRLQSSNSEQSFSKVDALVVHGKKMDAKSGYWTALALSQNKDVLCLLPQGSKVDEALSSLQADNTVAKKLHVVFYQVDDLQEKILDFLRLLDQDSLRDLFNIKYTLRVSRKINDYLNWKADKLGVRKADWLRDQIQDIIKDDSDYKKHLEGKYKLSK